MLSDAVQEVKGTPKEETFETLVDLNMDAYIPARYIPNEFQKLDSYKKIAGITDEADLDDVTDELIDRYGEPPASVIHLMRIAELKAAANRASISEIKETPSEVRLTVIKNRPSMSRSSRSCSRPTGACLRFTRIRTRRIFCITGTGRVKRC